MDFEIISFEPKTSYIKVCKSLPEEIKWTQGDFTSVWNSKPEEHGKFVIFNKVIDVPRWQKTYLHDYKFSGLQHPINTDDKLPAPVQRLLTWVQEQDKTVNGALINWYQDGHHYIGFHSDSEKELLAGSQIWSFSFGQEREFYLKDKKSNIVTKVPMPNNSLIVMCGTLQETHKHSVPKISGKKGESLKSRINVTFRSFQK